MITLESLHVSRSLRRSLRHSRFIVTESRDFLGVMNGCAQRSEGTWLSPEMKSAYLALHRAGYASSYEVWEGEQLVGGLYGVLIGGFYAAESKFHHRTDASKIALVCAITHLFARGLVLFDVQFLTEHLRSLGVFEVSRERYLKKLRGACERELLPRTTASDLLPQARSLLRI